MSTIHIDGDFPTGNECKHHCSPTCHPGQTDDKEWKYGCLHPVWPSNKEGDFCPLVKCGGKLKKCEVPIKFLKSALIGQRARARNAYSKARKAEHEIAILEYWIDLQKNRSPNGNQKNL
jgi:hypothetical protein